MADGFVLRHCPATSNLPTAMSRGAWKSLWIDSDTVHTAPPIPSKHLLDLATTFLANPNAGCEEVANWIYSVQLKAD